MNLENKSKLKTGFLTSSLKTVFKTVSDSAGDLTLKIAMGIYKKKIAEFIDSNDQKGIDDLFNDFIEKVHNAHLHESNKDENSKLLDMFDTLGKVFLDAKPNIVDARVGRMSLPEFFEFKALPELAVMAEELQTLQFQSDDKNIDEADLYSESMKP